DVFSCIQFKNVAKIRDVVPLSPEEFVPAKPFSISSIHKIEGAIASAVSNALRIFSSLLPTMPLNTRPISNFSKDKFHKEIKAFAIKLYSQPATPVISKPLGTVKQ